MESVFYSIEKGENWLTPLEKRQWREKYKALQVWFDKKGIESSPWLQVRLRELLITTFFIQRLEQELLLSTSSKVKNEIESNESHKKIEKMNASVQSYEVLCKYLERQRKLVQELEAIKPSDVKTSPISIVELVQDLMHCARELDKDNGKIQEKIMGTKEENKVGLNGEI